MMSTSTLLKRGTVAIAAVAMFALLFSTSANAALLSLEFSGLDISYDGSSIETVGADPLTSVTITPGADPPIVIVSSILVDLDIPGVSMIPIGGGTVSSAAGGILDLDLPGTDFLDLDLGVASVTFIDIGMIEFTFVGSAASVAGQALPFGLEIGDPVSISFSAPIAGGTLTDDGTFVTGFEAAGTGEIVGVLVPEPASLVLLGLAGLMGIISRRRRS